MEPVFYLTLIGFCCITIITIYLYIKLINLIFVKKQVIYINVSIDQFTIKTDDKQFIIFIKLAS